ncbi:type IV secretion system protein [Sphingobium wenxiniae]|nr:type IV secretion system protein [Sphingobium wenxiniae]
MAVVDVRAIAQALQTARNTLQQLQAAQDFYAKVNSVSNIRDVSNLLNNPLLQTVVPEGMQNSVQLVSADLATLGAIGNQARGLLDARDFSLGGMDQALGATQSILTKAASTNAAQQAYGEYLLESSDASSKGLTQLGTALGTATTLRQSQDIEARATIEGAQVSNRMLQLMAAEQAARARAALDAQEAFAASQRKTQQNIDSGALWPRWEGQ